MKLTRIWTTELKPFKPSMIAKILTLLDRIKLCTISQKWQTERILQHSRQHLWHSQYDSAKMVGLVWVKDDEVGQKPVEKLSKRLVFEEYFVRKGPTVSGKSWSQRGQVKATPFSP
jgi:hypothetical protein